MSPIEIERSAAVARVWFNRPELHNALSAELGAALAAGRSGPASCQLRDS
jgi:enoyl-CoA hydratase/carnithine racemase